MKLTIVCTEETYLPFLQELQESQGKYVDVKAYKDIEVVKGDVQQFIRSGNYDAVLSPGNSFGMLTGGVDLVMLQTFGLQLEVRLVSLIADAHNGELAIGSAATLRTVNPNCPWFVSAPTMRLPSVIEDSGVVYKAVYAARDSLEDVFAELLFEDEYAEPPLAKPRKPFSVVTPCFGTGTGKVDPAEAARLMMRAWIDHEPSSDDCDFTV